MIRFNTLFICLASATFYVSCNSTGNSNMSNDSTNIKTDTNNVTTSLKPVNPKPDWGKDMKDEMQVVIDKLASYNDPPIVTLNAVQARKNHTPADAVMDVMKEHNLPMPESQVDTMGKDIPVDGGTEHLRIYTPKSGNGPFPLIVYFHGGGWVIADVNTYNSSAQGLAEQVSAIVVSVNYRQGPEHKFPIAHHDAFAAYKWVLKNAASLKGDTSKIAVVGESAGGNLACAVSIMSRDQGFKLPLYQVLVYPIAGNDTTTESYAKNDMTKPLNKGLMVWFFKNYLNNWSEGNSPMISLVNGNLKGLPGTTIIGAELDPLMSEGKMLADKLKLAGVQVNYKLYKGVTHEFFGMSAVVPEAKEAMSVVTSDLKDKLNTK